MYTSNGESLYDALQAQLNRRFGNRFRFGANYTWSKTIAYSRQQWVSDQLLKDIAAGTRPQAANINFAYAIPGGSKLWNNKFTKIVSDDWHVEGVLTFSYGVPLTISCAAAGAPIGYWTGTPTGGLPFRCQQTGDLWLSSGATPASVGSTADPRLWYPFNPASFSLPPVTSLGIGNTPPTLTYGPGAENADISLYKQFRIKERNILELRAQAFNTLNHFNPGNPNTTLNINFANGQNMNPSFGMITSSSGAQLPARHMVLSARFKF